MKKVIIIALATTLGMGGVAMARGYGDHYGMGGCKAGMFGMKGGRHNKGVFSERMIKKLDLNEKQTKQVRAIVDQSRDKFRDIKDDMRDNRRELFDMVSNGKVNKSKARKLADAQGKHMADMIMLRISTKADIYQVLTPEQREKANELRDTYGGMRGH